MRNQHKTTKRIVIISSLAVITLLAGCGGHGGNPITASLTSSDSFSSVAKVAGTAAQNVLPENQEKYDALLKIESWVQLMPDGAFVADNDVRNDNVQTTNHKNQLVEIVSQIEAAVNDGKYDKAALMVEKKLIPKTDGCNGGNPENDLIMNCDLAINLYNQATGLLNALGAKNNGRAASRTAQAVDWDSYKQSILVVIGQIQTTLQNAADSFFKNPVGVSRATLLNLIDSAKICLEADDPQAAQDIMKNQFYPLIDGGNGGNPSDDLISSTAYSTADYTTAISDVQSVIISLKITMVGITAAPQTIGIGETIQLTAMCTYNNASVTDCSSTAQWTADSGAASVSAGGVLTGQSLGSVFITAKAGEITSAPVSVFVIYAGGFHDLFDDGYIDTNLWTDVLKGKSTMTEQNGAFRIQAGAYSFGQLVPIQYFKINPGEKLEFFVRLNPENSAGSYFVQGFGIYNQRTTGIAAGVAAGTSMAQPTIYFSSPVGYKNATVPSGKGDYKIVYQNRQASLYFNGNLIGTIAADLEGQRLTFFIYGSARNSSTLDATFDNFMTNQTDPGEYKIDLANNSVPFGFNNSGSITPGSQYTFKFYGDPNIFGVMGKLLDADTLQVIQGPFLMSQTNTPGVYSYTGTMPTTSSSNIVLAASDDNFNQLVIYSRRISTGRAAARASQQASQEKYIPADFPAFLLPTEIRGDK